MRLLRVFCQDVPTNFGRKKYDCVASKIFKTRLGSFLTWFKFSASTTDHGGRLSHSRAMRIKKEYFNELHFAGLTNNLQERFARVDFHW